MCVCLCMYIYTYVCVVWCVCVCVCGVCVCVLCGVWCVCVCVFLGRTSSLSKSYTNMQRDSKVSITSDILFPVNLVLGFCSVISNDIIGCF